VPKERGIQRGVGVCLTEGIAALGLLDRVPHILKCVAVEGIDLDAKIVSHQAEQMLLLPDLQLPVRRDQTLHALLESVRVRMVVAIDHENELGNGPKPVELSTIFPTKALQNALQGVAVVNLYNVACETRDFDNDVGKCIRWADLDFLLDAHCFRSQPVSRDMRKATNVTNDLLDEETEFEEILVIEMGKLHGNSALCVQALPRAAARYERRLLAVACTDVRPGR
jgi:hypothetical protein